LADSLVAVVIECLQCGFNDETILYATGEIVTDTITVTVTVAVRSVEIDKPANLLFMKPSLSILTSSSS